MILLVFYFSFVKGLLVDSDDLQLGNFTASVLADRWIGHRCCGFTSVGGLAAVVAGAGLFDCNDRNRDHDNRNWMSYDCSMAIHMSIRADR